MKSSPYLRLMRFDRPVGNILLLFPTLIALFIATNGLPSPLLLIVFTLGVLITRAAGCVINDIFDRNLDPEVERTKNRPIANKEISVLNATILFIGLTVLGVLLLIGFLPPVTYYYAVIAAVLLVIYPLSKRFFCIPQLFLGLAFSISIPMVYVAVGLNPFNLLTAWLLFFGNIVWVIAYDTQYAITDLDDDLKAGNVHSSAIFFGDKVNLIVFLLNLLYIISLVLIGYINQFSILFYLVISFNLFIFIYHYFYVDNLKPETGFKAFNENIRVGLITLLAVILGLIGANHQKYLDSQNEVKKLNDIINSQNFEYKQLYEKLKNKDTQVEKTENKTSTKPTPKELEEKKAIKDSPQEESSKNNISVEKIQNNKSTNKDLEVENSTNQTKNSNTNSREE